MNNCCFGLVGFHSSSLNYDLVQILNMNNQLFSKHAWCQAGCGFWLKGCLLKVASADLFAVGSQCSEHLRTNALTPTLLPRCPCFSGVFKQYHRVSSSLLFFVY